MPQCDSGKVCHRSESAARRVAIAVAEARTHDRPRVYACPLCHHWHLTSRPGLSRRERSRRRFRLLVPTPATPEEVAAFFARYAPPR